MTTKQSSVSVRSRMSGVEYIGLLVGSDSKSLQTRRGMCNKMYRCSIEDMFMHEKKTCTSALETFDERSQDAHEIYNMSHQFSANIQMWHKGIAGDAEYYYWLSSRKRVMKREEVEAIPPMQLSEVSLYIINHGRIAVFNPAAPELNLFVECNCIIPGSIRGEID